MYMIEARKNDVWYCVKVCERETENEVIKIAKDILLNEDYEYAMVRPANKHSIWEGKRIVKVHVVKHPEVVSL